MTYVYTMSEVVVPRSETAGMALTKAGARIMTALRDLMASETGGGHSWNEEAM
jgi:hypothetical protein